MLKNHSNGLFVLALTNMGERFGYYTMLAILTLYLQAKFGFSSASTSMIYGTFLALVYFLPVFGGIIADKWLGYGKTILIGVLIMFGGYLLLAMPFGHKWVGIVVMFVSLLLISAGTGLFKGNLQALIGKLYDDPRYQKNRDMAFSIFYMFINIGAFFAPSMGNAITNMVLSKQGFTYDASIPKNYVALNDKVVDESHFIQALQAKNKDFKLMSQAKQNEYIKAQKKKQGVMFEQDQARVLFNLKLAGLYQYTKSGKITDPNKTITEEEYAAYHTRDNSAEAIAKKDAVIAKVNSITINNPALLAPDPSKGFARDFGYTYVTESLSISYSLAFIVACISLIISVLIFVFFKRTWKAADHKAKERQLQQNQNVANEKIMSRAEVRERMIALFLVFAVVIFFWMAFHQNGLTMTFFARDYTYSKVSPNQYMVFSLFMLVPFICFMYGVYSATFGLLGGKKNVKTGLILIVLGIAGLLGGYFIDIKSITNAMVSITPQIFQQFNPFFIILLTPVTVGLFSYLSKLGKEPSAPRKIGIGMILAALGFVVLAFVSMGLPAPSTIDGGTSSILVSPNWLIGTYLILTLAELFLSPMGLSFVSKVAPPQYSGLMQGGWLAATAVGNFLVGVVGSFWEKIPLYAFWGVLIVLCLLSALFIFSVMKKLERVTAE